MCSIQLIKWIYLKEYSVLNQFMMSKVGSTSKDKLTIFGEEQYMQLVIQTEERRTASKQG